MDSAFICNDLSSVELFSVLTLLVSHCGIWPIKLCLKFMTISKSLLFGVSPIRSHSTVWTGETKTMSVHVHVCDGVHLCVLVFQCFNTCVSNSIKVIWLQIYAESPGAAIHESIFLGP